MNIAFNFVSINSRINIFNNPFSVCLYAPEPALWITLKYRPPLKIPALL